MVAGGCLHAEGLRLCVKSRMMPASLSPDRQCAAIMTHGTSARMTHGTSARMTHGTQYTHDSRHQCTHDSQHQYTHDSRHQCMMHTQLATP